jgi:hypothetical protein
MSDQKRGQMSDQKRGQGTQGDREYLLLASEFSTSKKYKDPVAPSVPCVPQTWDERLQQAKESDELSKLIDQVSSGRDRVQRIFRNTDEDELWLRWSIERREAT